MARQTAEQRAMYRDAMKLRAKADKCLTEHERLRLKLDENTMKRRRALLEQASKYNAEADTIMRLADALT